MRRLIAGLMATILLCYATPAPCSDHLLTADLVLARLDTARRQRDRNVADLRSFLSDPAVSRAAAAAHLDADSVATKLSALSDQELRDLADRAARIQTDPCSGLSKGVKITLIIAAIVTLSFIILVAADMEV